jgi:hypothetical protein
LEKNTHPERASPYLRIDSPLRNTASKNDFTATKTSTKKKHMVKELTEVISYYREIERQWVDSDKKSDEYLAAVCMFEYLSFRLREYDNHDRLIGFRLLVRTYRRMRRKNQGMRYLDLSSRSIITSSSKNQDDIIRYIQGSAKTEVHSYLDRDHMSLGDFGTLPLLMRWFPFAFVQALRCVFSTYRSRLALTIAEIPEIAFVLKYAKTNNIEMLYDFLPYEVDSNFMYLVFRKNGIRVFKIPSSGPFATHHKILISDDVALSSPYHFDEIVRFKDTFRVQQAILWPPYNAHIFYAKYKNKNKWEEAGTLGFYSHGEWLRRAEKHANYGGRISEAEEAILGMLGDIVAKNPFYKLRIFPHPKELRPELKAAREEYYLRCIGHNNFEIYIADGGTAQNFAKAEIAIAAFSTILYERLYCGFKTLIGNMYISRQFPMNNSNLNTICFRSQDELEDMLQQYGNMDADTFFSRTGLSDYRMEAFPEP